MSKRKTMLFLGILVAVMPFLGIPSSWKTVVYLLSGIFIAWNSYQINKHKAVRTRRAAKRAPKMVGTENAPANSSVNNPQERQEGNITAVS